MRKAHTSPILWGHFKCPAPPAHFKNGNSQAVRIPADLADEHTDSELEIERIGDEFRIRPTRRPLAGVSSKFAQLSLSFGAEDRSDHEQTERDGLRRPAQ